ncbi:hypothetical protein JHK85_043477 [Glycine max]|nr:hypothetical protein JHK85_043477 [Glycine max]
MDPAAMTRDKASQSRFPGTYLWAAITYLLHLVGSMIFADKSSTHLGADILDDPAASRWKPTQGIRMDISKRNKPLLEERRGRGVVMEHGEWKVQHLQLINSVKVNMLANSLFA